MFVTNFAFCKFILKKSAVKSGAFGLIGTYLISYKIMQIKKKPDYCEYYSKEEFEALKESGTYIDEK